MERIDAETMAKLLEIARSRNYVCLERSCPVFDLCPLRGEYPEINTDTWLARNCPKVRETFEQTKRL